MTETEYSKIGTRIAIIRRSNNLTQEQLAEMLNVTPKHISHVENSTSSFSLKQLIRFCETFNCSFDYLIFGDKENPALSKLPDGIVDILNNNDEKTLALLTKYLELFIELNS